MKSKADRIMQQVKEGYERIYEHFDKTRYNPWQEFKLFCQYIKPRQKILDLGCGNARLYKYFLDKGINVNYYGLDNSEKLINICKEKYPEIADKFIVSEMTKLPYQDNFFDLVICIATFHHLPTKYQRINTLEQVRRVLKPGSYFLMTNWHLWHRPFWKYFFNDFLKKVSLKDFFFPWKSPDGKIQCQRYYHAFTKGELKRLFRKSDFKVERIFTHNNAYKSYGRGVDVVSVVRK